MRCAAASPERLSETEKTATWVAVFVAGQEQWASHDELPIKQGSVQPNLHFLLTGRSQFEGDSFPFLLDHLKVADTRIRETIPQWRCYGPK